jgi:type IV secretory pathway VirJ component
MFKKIEMKKLIVILMMIIPPVEKSMSMTKSGVDDLPLILTKARNDSLSFAILISGDGGWTSWDQSLANSLAEKGISTVGLDARKYFWSKKTPEETTIALTEVIRQYSQLWKKQTCILIGYSFGADLIPFIAARLPRDFKNELQALVLLSPDPKADFEVHIADMLNFGSSSDTYDVVKEINKKAISKILCVFGEEENAASINAFKVSAATVRMLPGDHHYNNNFKGAADLILKFIK